MERIKFSMVVEKAPHLEDLKYDIMLPSFPNENKKFKKDRFKKAIEAFTEAAAIEFLFDGDAERYDASILVDDWPEWVVAQCEGCEKLLEEDDEYTTCDNSGTTECKACEVKRLKVGA